MNITVTISELVGAANSIKQANEAFRAAAEAMKQAAAALAEEWSGDARDAFVAEQEQIDSWYKTMAEVVDGYIAAMQQSAADYQETDNEAANIVKKG
ncbi:MAG: WXG100 family type VII secretion target [Clostridia bacterium]|nr:WXG100 family type VII secretion target [Clostridia bacterium]